MSHKKRNRRNES